MKKLFLLGLALLAVYMGGRAAKRNAEVLQLLWVLIGMTATLNGAGTAKSRSTEQRLNDLIPAVFPNTGGTITGNVTVTGSHTVDGGMAAGSLSVNGASGSATVAVSGNIHASSTVQADGGVNTTAVSASGGVSAGSLSVNGGSGGATVAVAGSVHASSTGQFDGGVTTSAVNATGGGTNEFSGGIHSAGTVQADGNLQGSVLIVNGQRIAPGQGRPAFYPVAGGSSPSTASIGVALNEIVGCLIAAGISA